jgi:N-acyl homoserine lactone hydrolase
MADAAAAAQGDAAAAPPPSHACWRLDLIEVGVLPGCELSAYTYDAEPGASADLPCFCWLLRDGRHTVLVDTGPDATQDVGYEVAGDTRANLLGGLAAAGASPGEVELIVHTHLHQDHVQNDGLFARAALVVQARELHEARRGEQACRGLPAARLAALAAAPYAESQQAGIWYTGTAALERAAGARLRTVDGDLELLPGLCLVRSGGHSLGHQSVVAATVDGPVCLAGDVASLGANIRRPGPMTPDAAAAAAFLARAAAAGWELIPSHEPAMRAHRWAVPPALAAER